MADESIYPSYLDEQGKFKTQFSPEEQTALLNDVNESRKQAANGGTTFAHGSVDAKSLIPAVTHGVENGYLTNYIKNKYSRLKEPQISDTTTEQTTYNPVEPFDREKFTQEWQAGSKPVMQMLMENYKKPEPTLTPEQEQKAKFGAALTDTMGTLAQIFAHGQGARVRDTSAQPSNTQITNARLQALNDKYAQDIYRYNQAYGNAAMLDFNQLLEQDKAERGYKREYNLYKQKDAAAKAKALQEAAKAKQDQQNWEKNYAQKNKQHQEDLALGYARLKKEKKADTEKFAGLVINAHPSDNTAQVDATGNRVVRYKMSKPEIQNLAMTAKSNESFMKRHPELSIDKPDMFGVPHKGLTTDEEIANAYAQEQYNSKFAHPQQPAPAWKMPKVPGTGSNKKKTIPGF